MLCSTLICHADLFRTAPSFCDSFSQTLLGGLCKMQVQHRRPQATLACPLSSQNMRPSPAQTLITTIVDLVLANHLIPSSPSM